MLVFLKLFSKEFFYQELSRFLLKPNSLRKRSVFSILHLGLEIALGVSLQKSKLATPLIVEFAPKLNSTRVPF